jgi:AmmeMemoRadiSam system protein B
VVGDTHTGDGSAEIAVWAAGAFETPLGRVPVDEAVAQAVVDADARIRFDRAAFEYEHPVENQLPFIQTVCPGARVVPVVIREPSLENAQVLADALVAAFGGRPALIVASTDLSHYHPYDEARRIDEVALQAVVSLDPQAIIDSPHRCTELGVAHEPSTLCSQGAVLTALIAAQGMGANRATVLHYANSGDVPIGKQEAVVGYGAVALWQDTTEGHVPAGFALPPAPGAPTASIPLSAGSRAELLALARHTAAQFLTYEFFPPFQTDDPALLQPLGAYVTYEQDGLLRGCLGQLMGDRPAYLNVQYAAAAAALADSRFPPVTPQELAGLTIEITLLEPLRQVESPDEIEIDRHGVLMRLGEATACSCAWARRVAPSFCPRCRVSRAGTGRRRWSTCAAKRACPTTAGSGTMPASTSLKDSRLGSRTRPWKALRRLGTFARLRLGQRMFQHVQ